MSTNRFGAACPVCSTYVRPGQGTRVPAAGGWETRCNEHTNAPSAAPPSDTDEDLPPAEIRITGTKAQIAAVYEALGLSPGLSLRDRSAPRARRDPGDNRVSSYGRVHIDPRHLASAARDLAQIEEAGQ